MPNLQKAAPLEPQKAAIPELQNKAAIPKPTAAATITGAVARSLIGPIRAQYHSKPAVIEAIISESFKHSGLPKDEHTSLYIWAIAGAADDHLLSRYTAVHLQGFIHALYLAACDGLGPVAADKLLSTSIARAQALPAAVEFSPNLLL